MDWHDWSLYKRCKYQTEMHLMKSMQIYNVRICSKVFKLTLSINRDKKMEQKGFRKVIFFAQFYVKI